MRRWTAAALFLTGCPRSSPPVTPTPPIQIAPTPAPPPNLQLDAEVPGSWDYDDLDPQDGDPATLTFGWPAGAEATVRHTVVALQYNGDVMSSRTVTQAEWTETFSASEDRHRYTHRDATGSTRIEPPPPAAEVIQALMTELVLAAIETVVDDEGRWAAVDGLDARRAEIAGRVAPLVDGLPGPLQDALTTTLEQGLSQEAVEQDSKRRWSALVEDWIGGEHTIGEEIEVDGAIVAARGWVPCSPDAEEAACVVLERTVTASAEEVEQARARVQSSVMANWPPGAPMPTLGESEMVTTELLITRPDTLLPAAYTKRKAATHAFHVGDRVVPWGTDLRTSTTWTWTLP